MSTFEIDDKDLLGRNATLELGAKTIETPALMPVINPHLDIPDLSEAQIVITNSYILKTSDDYSQEDLVEGDVHDVIDFDGVVVTDSGSYQLSVYGEGEIDAGNREILEFQRDIGSDVITPLDIPTDPDASRETTEIELETTEDRIGEASKITKDWDVEVNYPVQGGVHKDLRTRAGESVMEYDPDICPIGGVVPLMENYRYPELVDVVIAAKKGLGSGVPVHLFGAGHPMIFALAVAMGCDLFDSAAYALYAKQGRYLTVEGTREIEDMTELPCTCRVCRGNQPEDLDKHPGKLVEHNLAVSFAEIRRVREAVRSGDLYELLERRCRSHPKLLDGLKRYGEHVDYVEKYDPACKSTFFYLGSSSRPEVYRQHERLDRFDLSEYLGEPDRADYAETDDGETENGEDQSTGTELDEEVLATTQRPNGRDVLLVRPPFPPYPRELAQTYPFNAELSDEPGDEAIDSSLRGLERLMELHPGKEFRLEHPGWSPEKYPRLGRLIDNGMHTRDVDS
ncbi:MAG: tRNA guanosine(15) transglycosylase TgtA [Halobacteria archaeon]